MAGPTNPTVGLPVLPANTTAVPVQGVVTTSAPTVVTGTETEVWGAGTVSAPNNVAIPGGFQIAAATSGAHRTDAAIVVNPAFVSSSGPGGAASGLDIRTFGTWANGVDCTATFLKGIVQVNANAAAGTGSTTLVIPSITPPGVTGPIVQVVMLPGPYTGNIVPSGCVASFSTGSLAGVLPNFANGTSLVGTGPGSVISCGFANQTSGIQQMFLFFHNSNFYMYNVTVDGNKANFTDNTGTGTVQQILVFPFTTNIAHCLFQNVTVHDVAHSGSQESFGLCLWAGATDVTFLNCTGYNCSGTPLHILGGATLATTACTNIRVIGGVYYSNTFQGISDYNSNNIQYIGVKCYSNGLSGFNSEMSGNVQYWDCISYSNSTNGYACIGGSWNVEYWNCYSGAFGQAGGGVATGANSQYEFIIGQSTFYPAGILSALPQGPIALHNCHVYPASGRSHLATLARYTPTGSSAGSYLSSLGAHYATTFPPIASIGPIIIDQPDIDTWVIWDSTAGNQSTMAVGLKISQRTAMRPVLVGKLNSASWTAAGTGLTEAANTIGGPLGDNAVNLSNTTAGVGTYSTPNTLLLPNKVYLLRWEYNCHDVNATWQIQIVDSTSAILYNQSFTNATGNDRSAWYENSYIIKTGATNTAGIVLSPTGTPTGTSVVSIDYVGVYELEKGNNLSET